MQTTTFDTLNQIYENLCLTADSIRRDLKTAGYDCALGFYNNHYVKRGGGFAREIFPIPVLMCGDFDIGVDLESVWVEFRLPRDNAAKLDFDRLRENYNFQVYGSGEYLTDFEGDSADIAEQIANSGEETICAEFDLPSGKPFPIGLIAAMSGK